jgi:hypothetical protein
MSSYVQGLRDMDGEFKKMLEMKRLCDAKGFSYPSEVRTYFGSNIGESEKYMTEQMLKVDIPSKIVADDNDGIIEIDVKDIPKEVKKIRFINSF